MDSIDRIGIKGFFVGCFICTLIATIICAIAGVGDIWECYAVAMVAGPLVFGGLVILGVAGAIVNELFRSGE